MQGWHVKKYATVVYKDVGVYEFVYFYIFNVFIFLCTCQVIVDKQY